jgi:hypothetical protein
LLTCSHSGQLQSSVLSHLPDVLDATRTPTTEEPTKLALAGLEAGQGRGVYDVPSAIAAIVR